MGTRPSRVDDPLRNTLVIEMKDLLAQHEILEQRRTPLSGFQAVLIVAHGNAVVGSQHVIRTERLLVRLAAVAEFSLMDVRHEKPRIAC